MNALTTYACAICGVHFQVPPYQSTVNEELILAARAHTHYMAHIALALAAKEAQHGT